MKFIAQHADGSIFVMPDTALHITKRPFFIPDFAEPCICQVMVAVRICRLGKGIGKRWAHRYYDQATLVTNMHTPALPPSQGYGFDDSISVGEWQGVEMLTEEQKACAADLISKSSCYFTLRQGDIIIVAPHSEEFPVTIGDRIDIPPYLEYNIK